MNRVDEEEMIKVKNWIDTFSLSRVVKNFEKDFCDGILIAEILKKYYPTIIDIRHYEESTNTKKRINNWNTLILRVFNKINFKLSQEQVELIVNCKPNAVENLLWRLYYKIELKKKYVKHKIIVKVNHEDEVPEIVRANKKIDVLSQENNKLAMDLLAAKTLYQQLLKNLEKLKNEKEYKNIPK